MTTRELRHALRLLLAAVLLALGALGAAWADPPGRVGRLAMATGTVWIYDQEQGEWLAVAVNRPITTGDRVATDNNARADIQIGSASLRLDGGAELAVDQLDDQRVSLRLERGSAALRLRSAESVNEFELLANDARFQPTRTGQYRLDLRDNVATAQAWSGEMRFQSQDSALQLQPGTRYSFWRQDDRTHYDMATTSGEDAFGAWVLAQDQREAVAATPRYVSPEMTGATDLDRYGRWDSHPEYGAVWYPTTVVAGWAPYRYGHWAWVAPWGWSWVDDAPWGFAPFHYGRWAYWSNRWCWVPGRYVARPVYAPALVGWIGGNNISVAITAGRRPPPPMIGWVPLAPRDPYVPRFNATPRYIHNINRGHAPWQPPPGSAQPWFNRHAPGAVTVVATDTLRDRSRIADRVVPRVEPRWNAALPVQQPLLPPPPGRNDHVGRGDDRGDRGNRGDRGDRGDRPDRPGQRGDGPAAGFAPPPPDVARPGGQPPPGAQQRPPQPPRDVVGQPGVPQQGNGPGQNRPPQGANGQPGTVAPPGAPPRPPREPGDVAGQPGGPQQGNGPGQNRPPQGWDGRPGARGPQEPDQPDQPGRQGRPGQPGQPDQGQPGQPGHWAGRPDGQRPVPPPPVTVTTQPGGAQPQAPGTVSTRPGVPPPPAPQGVAPPGQVNFPGQGGRPPGLQGGFGGQQQPGAVPSPPRGAGQGAGGRDDDGDRNPPLRRSDGYQAGGDSVPGAPPRVGRDQIPPQQRGQGEAPRFDNPRPAMPTVPGNRVPPEPPRGAPAGVDNPRPAMPTVPPPGTRVPQEGPRGPSGFEDKRHGFGPRAPAEPPRAPQAAVPMQPPAAMPPPQPVMPRPAPAPERPQMPQMPQMPQAQQMPQAPQSHQAQPRPEVQMPQAVQPRAAPVQMAPPAAMQGAPAQMGQGGGGRPGGGQPGNPGERRGPEGNGPRER